MPALERPLPKRLAGRCVYCGARAPVALACPAHRDLLKLDPHYTHAHPQR